MSLAIVCNGKSMKYWVDALRRQDPALEIEVYPEIKNPDNVIGVLAWRHPHGSLNQFKNLKWISSVGAGVDHVLSDPKLPDVPITRIVDNFLALDISRTALMGVIGFEKMMPIYIRQKRAGVWKSYLPKRLKNIGILGLGEMGSRIAQDLMALEYKVRGFSRTEKKIHGIDQYWGSSIPDEFFSDLDVLINVLPLTEQTTGILNLELFNKMPKGSFIINLGRGMHLVENDLITALKDNHLGGAYLDVFNTEPLPEDHPFWNEEKIVLTPHIASVTDPDSAAKLVIENYRRVSSGGPLLHEIDRWKGY